MLKKSNSEQLSEYELMAQLGPPKTAQVTRTDGKPHGEEVPGYQALPTAQRHTWTFEALPDTRLIDFGEAFTSEHAPQSLRTPLVLRAPEVLFGDKLDFRVDIWSAGCTVSCPGVIYSFIIAKKRLGLRNACWTATIRHNHDYTRYPS